MFLDDLLNKT
jgi:hypothetical protein